MRHDTDHCVAYIAGDFMVELEFMEDAISLIPHKCAHHKAPEEVYYDYPTQAAAVPDITVGRVHGRGRDRGKEM